MADHDQRLKTLLQEFFEEFFLLFFPRWAERFDFSQVEWLDKEIFTDPPQGQRRVLDVVARVGTRKAIAPQRPDQPESWIALIHIEIEQADKVTGLRPRMFDYYIQLRRQHQVPVLPIALYLQVGLEGLGQDVYQEYFWEMNLLRFEYLYVGLPALDAENYVTKDNHLAVALASLMRISPQRKAWLQAETLRRIMEFPDNNWRRFLLCEFVQAYLPLDEDQHREFDRLLTTEPYKGVQAMAATWFEQGIAKGLEKGLEKGKRLFLIEILEARFGLLSPQVRERVESLPADQLIELGRAALRAQSLQELGMED